HAFFHVGITCHQLVEQLGSVHLAIGKDLTVEKHSRHTLNITLRNQFRVKPTINHFGGNQGIDADKLVKRLHHIRAVMATQTNKYLEVKRILDIGQHVLNLLVKFDWRT